LSKYAFSAQGLSSADKEEILNKLIDLLKEIYTSKKDRARLARDAQELQSLVDEGFTGKEWRTLVRQLGQILAAKRWSAGIELLERMMDWNEVLDLLKKADHHFNLGLSRENGWIYLPIDGEKTIRRSDFKVLRPMKSMEKKELKLKEREETKI